MRIVDTLQSVGRAINEPTPAVSGSASAAGGQFGRIVASLMASASDAVATSEIKSAQGMAGQVPVHEVVQSILDAEQKLSAAISVRDRCVAAYQEIVRMQI